MKTTIFWPLTTTTIPAAEQHKPVASDVYAVKTPGTTQILEGSTRFLEPIEIPRAITSTGSAFPWE
ncbi:MAG TPA: hypothetical protein VKZ86_02740 [Cyclobacteriaceae bacterium]|nr:hypothetical protein [Cyclobacteriaceae bacterium]